MIEIHIEEYYLYFSLNIKSKTIDYNNKLISLEKRALLIIIEHIHENPEGFPIILREWFNSYVENTVDSAEKKLGRSYF